MFKKFKNNNHNLISNYKLLHFCNIQFYNAFYRILILEEKFKLEKLVYNICMKLRTCIHVGPRVRENSIVADVKFSKRDFNFYCRLLHEISVVDSNFLNATTNILCGVLNSRLLRPTSILKFSFIFIEFRYT